MEQIMAYIWIITSVVIPVVALSTAYLIAASYKHDAYVARLEMEDANNRVISAHRRVEDIKAELAVQKSNNREAASSIDKLNDDIARAMDAHRNMERHQDDMIKEISRLSAMAEPDDVAPPPTVQPPIRSIDIT